MEGTEPQRRYFGRIQDDILSLTFPRKFALRELNALS